ncbi:MAG: hypothetical protein U5K56_01615 [Halioglobus sp.]|nr:hypothetical protein [Halioglobus sp.]
MIEALVTFVILAIGLLGIVTLMTTSKTTQFEAVQRTRAVTLANGMLKRHQREPGRPEDLRNRHGQSSRTEPDTNEPAPELRDGHLHPTQMAAHDLLGMGQQLDGNRVTVTKEQRNRLAGLKAIRGNQALLD